MAAAHVTPATRLARMHAKQTAPGTAQQGSAARTVGTAGAILGGIVLTGVLLNLARTRRAARFV